MISRRDLLRAALASPFLSRATVPDLGETARAAPSARQVVLDVETTGLEVACGHRIMEIGCVELGDRHITGRYLHRYINPGRDCEPWTSGPYGLDRAKREPSFVEIASELLAFIAGSELIIHNAPFDIGFLDAEFARLAPLDSYRFRNLCPVVDTLTLARRHHPGRRNNLDSLCRRYGLQKSHPGLTGALLDARITADVYLAMTGGCRE